MATIEGVSSEGFSVSFWTANARRGTAEAAPLAVYEAGPYFVRVAPGARVYRRGVDVEEHGLRFVPAPPPVAAARPTRRRLATRLLGTGALAAFALFAPVGSEDFAPPPTIAAIENPSDAPGEARREDLLAAEFARAEASSAEEPSSAEASTTVADDQEANESAEPPHEADDALRAAAMRTTDVMDEPPTLPTAAANTEEQATVAHAPRAIASSPAPVTAPGRRFFVQVGAYRDEKLAARVCERVAALGFDAAVVTRPSRSWYFCRSQQPRGVGEAKALIQQIEALKIGAPLLVPARQSG